VSAVESELRERRGLSGRTIRSRRLPWVSLIGLVGLGLLLLTTADRAKREARSIGVEIELVDEGLEIVGLTPGDPAERSGLRVGDLLLRVGGREVPDFAAYDAAAKTFRSGSQTDFKVQREGQPTLIQVTPGRAFPWLTVIVEWLACLGYLALGATALVQLPGDLRARLLMILSLAIALELAMPFDLLGFELYSSLSYPFLSLLIGLQIATELHLAVSVPDRRRFGRQRRWLVPAFYAVGCGLGFLMALSLVFDSLGWELLPWTLAQAEVAFWDIGGVVWAVAVVALLATAAFKNPDPLGRQQTLLVLMAGLPWSIHMVATVVSLQLGMSYPAWLGLVEPLVLLAYPLGIFVAIFRHQLFDLEVVVKRGLVYACLTGLLVLVFYASIGAGGAFLSSFLPGDNSVWLIGFATLLMGLLFSPMRKATQRLIDRQFFPERTALRQQLIQLAGDLPARGSLPAMGRELVEQMSSMLGLESAAVLLGAESGVLSPLASTGVSTRADEALLLSGTDPAVQALRRTGRPLPIDHLETKSPTLHGKLSPYQAAVLVPLLRRDQLVGVLVLGRKLGGRPFPAEEMELLNLLSHHVATAFEYSQLYESATRDGLTGLLRRGAVLDAMNTELDRSRRFGRPLAVAMADLDSFKEVNDRYGHLKGDLTLKRVAEVMQRGLRVTDQVGRFGGEEFLMVLPETDLDGVHVVAEKLRNLVEGVRVRADNGEEIRVTISIGVVALEQFATGSRPEVNELIEAADAALYEAKAGGRNRVEMRAIAG
jgi:diguanylate cyclase (GGDEF)-like protein